ncbi:MAG: hypothetical protein KTR20_02530 [Cellvibrionaceae bacterium]|nr:hypothetical protein [Cellvibrionaceae bacterium]
MKSRTLYVHLSRINQLLRQYMQAHQDRRVFSASYLCLFYIQPVVSIP